MSGAFRLEERNLLWLSLISDEWRCSFVDADSIMLHMVAGYRAALAEHLGEPAWQDLTERLLANSPGFQLGQVRITIYTPADNESEAKLRSLAAG